MLNLMINVGLLVKVDENFSKLKHEDITSWCFQNNSKTVNLMDQSETTICKWTKTS